MDTLLFETSLFSKRLLYNWAMTRKMEIWSQSPPFSLIERGEDHRDNHEVRSRGTRTPHTPVAAG
jgi:hypothetical protein